MAEPRTPDTRKRRLGKGLSGLIINSHPQQPSAGTYQPVEHAEYHPTADSAPCDSPSRYLPVSSILPNPHQPRQDFSDTELQQLAESIRQQGLLQPLLVAPSADDANSYVLIAGERRLRAAKIAGLATVPCLVRKATPADMLELALVENLQRQDLNPIERALGYRDFMAQLNLSQTDAARRLAQPRATIANHLRLLDLCDEIQQMISDGLLSFGHGKALAGLADQQAGQLAIARRAVGEGLSVRQVEKLVADVRSRQAAAEHPTAPAAKAASKPAYLTDLEERLTEAVGTRVRILPGRSKHSGRIVLDYYNLDDFDRIASRLGLQ